MQQMITISQREGAEEFLNFEGDFEGECVDEGTKLNLNAFAAWRPDKVVEGKLNEYDQYKEFLVKFLSNPQYENLFEKADVKPQDVVRNIGDWVDSNEQINEMGGVMGGPEDSIYNKQEEPYPIKNGKFTTPEEVYLVEGVVDDWYFPLRDRFTIYGDEKVDVCSAQPDVVSALIVRYLENKPNAPALNLTDQETMDRLLAAIAEGCALGGTAEQLKNNVSQALDAAVIELSGGEAPQPGTQTPAAGGGAAGFGQYIATEPRFFSLKLTGMVGDVVVTIRTTLDVKDNNPGRWKVLYWRVY
jgi:hypothetical protein